MTKIAVIFKADLPALQEKLIQFNKYEVIADYLIKKYPLNSVFKVNEFVNNMISDVFGFTPPKIESTQFNEENYIRSVEFFSKLSEKVTNFLKRSTNVIQIEKPHYRVIAIPTKENLPILKDYGNKENGTNKNKRKVEDYPAKLNKVAKTLPAVSTSPVSNAVSLQSFDVNNNSKMELEATTQIRTNNETTTTSHTSFEGELQTMSREELIKKMVTMSKETDQLKLIISEQQKKIDSQAKQISQIKNMVDIISTSGTDVATFSTNISQNPSIEAVVKSQMEIKDAPNGGNTFAFQKTTDAGKNEEKIQIDHEVADAIKKMWDEFHNQVLIESEKDFNKIQNDPELLHRVETITRIKDSFSVTHLPKMIKHFKVSEEEKIQKHSPNAYIKHPLIKPRGVGAFNQNIIHGEMTPSQFGSTTVLPLTVQPMASNQYLFSRSEDFHTHEKRKKFLKTYYMPALQAGEGKLAAKALLVLFSHVLKQMYYLIKTNQKVNFRNISAYLDAELDKMQVKRISQSFFTEFLRPELQDYQRRAKHAMGSLPSKLFNPPTRKIDDYTSSKNLVNSVETIWVSKKEKITQTGVAYPELTDEVIIDKDINVYDKDSGHLIFSLRKGVLNQAQDTKDAINTINKYVFVTSQKTINESGSKQRNDRQQLASVPVNTSQNSLSGVVPTTFTAHNYYSAEILEACGKITQVAEAWYEKIAPEEFNFVSEILAPYEELMFPGAKVTAGGVFNFDNPTNSHRDKNGLNGKFVSFLTCFWGSDLKRFSGGYLLFPEYKLAINIDQGDILLADFESNLHCNTRIIFLDNDKDEWHRLTLVGYTKRDLVKKGSKGSYETSDTEVDITNEQITSKQPLPKTKKDSFTLVKSLRAAENTSIANGKRKRIEMEAQERLEKRNKFTNSFFKPSKEEADQSTQPTVSQVLSASGGQ